MRKALIAADFPLHVHGNVVFSAVGPEHEAVTICADNAQAILVGGLLNLGYDVSKLVDQHRAETPVPRAMGAAAALGNQVLDLYEGKTVAPTPEDGEEQLDTSSGWTLDGAANPR